MNTYIKNKYFTYQNCFVLFIYTALTVLVNRIRFINIKMFCLVYFLLDASSAAFLALAAAVSAALLALATAAS